MNININTYELVLDNDTKVVHADVDENGYLWTKLGKLKPFPPCTKVS